METNLFFVTLQAFTSKGPLIENKYYDLPLPFFPEDAKKKYVLENKEFITDKANVKVIGFSNVEECRARYEADKVETDLLDSRVETIREKAARGEYGELGGDEALEKAKADMQEVEDERLRRYSDYLG